MANTNQPQLTADVARAIVTATTFDIFNEHDQSKRRRLMEKFWSADVTCYSPFGAAIGYDALDQVWGGEHPYLSFFVQPTQLVCFDVYI